MEMLLKGGTVKELKFTEWEGKQYYSLLLDGGMVSPKIKLDQDQFRELNSQGVSEGTKIDITFDVQYSDKTRSVHNTSKMKSYKICK